MKNIMDHFSELVINYDHSVSRQLWLDYDGSLVPFARRPKDAKPGREVKKLLHKLGSDPANRVLVISGRDRDTLSDWLGDLPVQLVAEHGAFFKPIGSDWENFLTASTEWKANVISSLDALVYHYEGTFVEEKQYSLTWHYREVALDISDREVQSITRALRKLPIANEFGICVEACSIELRSKGVDKGRFAQQAIRNSSPVEFRLALGDGRTDEDLFRAFGESSYTVRVGHTPDSAARFFVRSQQDVVPLLATLQESASHR